MRVASLIVVVLFAVFIVKLALNNSESQELETDHKRVVNAGRTVLTPDIVMPSVAPAPTETSTRSVQIGSPSDTLTASNTSTPSPTRTRHLTPTPAVPTAKVTADVLNVRTGPGKVYPRISKLRKGNQVPIIGKNVNWWQIRLADGRNGWIHGGYVTVLLGSTDDVDQILAPPTPKTTSTPQSIPTTEVVLANNRADFTGNQEGNGWTYLMEEGRNSGRFHPMPRFDGSCWRTGNWEHDVRICADGEVHPGQSTRIAYQWRVPASRQLRIQVHAHKIDTRCGDGVWVGIYGVFDERSGPRKLGDFQIHGGDNRGRTVKYSEHFDQGSQILVLVDIRGDSTCDMTRLYIDVF